MRAIVIAMAGLLLSACVHSHSFPIEPAFGPVAGPPDMMTVFVDRHGTPYPNGWEQTYPHARKVSSLRLSVRGSAELSARLEAEQQEMRRALMAFAADKRRVFILLHGFRDPQPGADEAFAAVREAIAFAPTDGVINLHWDGLQSNLFGVGNIWFESGGTSQLVGIRALRDILNDLQGKEFVLISHSRGASVILSALSNPSFDQNRALQEANDLDFTLEPLPLQGPRGTINAILLAPAIGCPDFWKPRSQWTPGGDILREIPAQVSSIQYTVNADDSVLSKKLGGWFPGLTSGFNATNFGWDPTVGAYLQGRYPQLRGHVISGIDHDFLQHARHPVLRAMLGLIGVQTKPQDDSRSVSQVQTAAPNTRLDRDVCETLAPGRL